MQPIAVRALCTSFSVNEVPIRLEISVAETDTFRFLIGALFEEVPTYIAPAYSISNKAARADASSANSGSTPRSNRRDASELRMCRRELRAIETESK